MTAARGASAPTSAPASPRPPASAPRGDGHTPRHLAEKILAGRDALQGERKQVTVLFADVVGSTELIRDRDPEEAQKLLDGAVQQMMAAVHRYEGTVSRLMGDGLMAMFGAPVAHEDHAVRACYATLAMLESVREFAAEALRTHAATIQVRVGLNSGEVIVRLISDDLHMDYTAMGQTVHLASRMETLAAPNTALLTPSTLALAEAYVETRPLGPREVRGLDRPVEVAELLGAGVARTRLEAAVARGLTRFVGRDDERASISRALARARAGQGQVVALVGEPGVGKSRLVWETNRAAEADGWTVLQAGAVSHGTAVPYLPILDLLRSYCRIEPTDRAELVVEKVGQRLLALDPVLLSALPPLLALLAVPVEDAAWRALDPAGRRRATLDALVQLLLRESRERPLLLVVEDLHWLDSESQALLDALVESLPTARIVLLVNYRPEYTHAWGNKSTYRQLRVEALGGAGADQLLSALLGGEAAVAPLKPLLIARTEGNPFFLEESVRSLVETGVLHGERGAYQLARPVDTIRVPVTVQAVLAARIDRLPPEQKRLLQTAAVIGKDVPYPLLQAIAETPDDALRSSLAQLQAGELIYPVTLFPEPEYTFKHALTHDVAYGSLLQDRRKSLHADIVAALERLYPDRLDEHVEQLAHHALRADDWPRAVTYARAAGQKALARSAYREGIRWLEQAYEVLPRLPDSVETRELGVDLRLDLRHALSPLSAHEPIMKYLREAESIATSLDDLGRLAAVYAVMCHHLRNQSQHVAVLAIAVRALDLAAGLGHDMLEAFIRFQIGMAHFTMGSFPESAASFRAAVSRLDTLPPVDGFGLNRASVLPALSTLGSVLAELGDFDDAIVFGEDGLRAAELTHDAARIASNATILGRIFQMRGDLERGRPPLERSLSVARAAGISNPLVWSMANLGALDVKAGRPESGVQRLKEGIRLAHATGDIMGLAERLTWLAEGYLASDRIDDARRTATEALDRAGAHQERASQAAALRMLGDIATQAGAPDAESRYHDALSLAEELGMRPLQAHCHLGLGKLYRQLERIDEARAELTTAVAMLREMGMALWLPDAEAALASLT
ncbi:MAG: AAA family ATPase [Chloroflexota bacterium]